MNGRKDKNKSVYLITIRTLFEGGIIIRAVHKWLNTKVACPNIDVKTVFERDQGIISLSTDSYVS